MAPAGSVSWKLTAPPTPAPSATLQHTMKKPNTCARHPRRKAVTIYHFTPSDLAAYLGLARPFAAPLCARCAQRVSLGLDPK